MNHANKKTPGMANGSLVLAAVIALGWVSQGADGQLHQAAQITRDTSQNTDAPSCDAGSGSASAATRAVARMSDTRLLDMDLCREAVRESLVEDARKRRIMQLVERTREQIEQTLNQGGDDSRARQEHIMFEHAAQFQEVADANDMRHIQAAFVGIKKELELIRTAPQELVGQLRKVGLSEKQCVQVQSILDAARQTLSTDKGVTFGCKGSSTALTPRNIVAGCLAIHMKIRGVLTPEQQREWTRLRVQALPDASPPQKK